MQRATVVLVPGGFTGPWIWAEVVALLEQEGIPSIAIELPTIGEGNADADFYGDARAVREALDRLDWPVLLCGHSYGCAVITEAAAGPHPSVGHLLYLMAAVPSAGDTLVSLMAAAAEDAGGEAQEEGVIFREDGLAELDREAAHQALFNDCSPERAAEGLDRLRPGNVVSGGSQPLTGAAWTQLPATYVRGTEDRMPEAVAPTFWEQHPEVIELPAGHCPNWSRPELVAELLVRKASAAQVEWQRSRR